MICKLFTFTLVNWDFLKYNKLKKKQLQRKIKSTATG